jgi:hypothetical protein
MINNFKDFLNGTSNRGFEKLKKYMTPTLAISGKEETFFPLGF